MILQDLLRVNGQWGVPQLVLEMIRVALARWSRGQVGDLRRYFAQIGMDCDDIEKHVRTLQYQGEVIQVGKWIFPAPIELIEHPCDPNQYWLNGCHPSAEILQFCQPMQTQMGFRKILDCDGLQALHRQISDGLSIPVRSFNSWAEPISLYGRLQKYCGAHNIFGNWKDLTNHQWQQIWLKYAQNEESTQFVAMSKALQIRAIFDGQNRILNREERIALADGFYPALTPHPFGNFDQYCVVEVKGESLLRYRMLSGSMEYREACYILRKSLGLPIVSEGEQLQLQEFYPLELRKILYAFGKEGTDVGAQCQYDFIQKHF